MHQLQPYPVYKDSGIPWLDKVPEHWEVRRLKTAVDHINEQTSTKNDEDLYIALEHVESWTGRLLVPSGEAQFDSQVKRFRAGDVLFGKLRPYLAKVVCPKQSGVCVGEFFVLRARPVVAPHYLEVVLRSARAIDFVNSSTYGAKMPRADWTFVGAMLFPLPPLPEQTAIVRFLDWADRRIRRYIRAKQKQIKLLEEYKQALTHQAVTGKIDVRTGQPYPAYKDSGVPWLGEVPEHWEVRRLRASVQACISGIWGNEPDGYYDLPCVRVADFDRNTRRVRMTNPTIRRVEPNERIHRILRPGDLLLEKSGGGEQQPVGVVVLYDHQVSAVYSNFIARMTVSEGYDSRFLVYLHATLYAVQLNVRSIRQTTGIQNLDTKMYLSELVAFPPLPEQTAIVDYLDAQTAKIDAAITAIRRAIELLREYRERLIADVVTGKVDVREVAARLPEEPPEEEAEEPEALDDAEGSTGHGADEEGVDYDAVSEEVGA
jgi:type I restriction enzyme S subunit